MRPPKNAYGKYQVKPVETLVKTSMMWTSQNFFLYNETIIKIKVNVGMNN